MSLDLYGIRNCDTMKKARSWLDEQHVDDAFHDYKVSGIDAASLEKWCNEHGWDKVLNRAGTTFRKLDEAQKSGLDQTRAIELMLALPYTPLYTSERVRMGLRSASTMPGALVALALMK